MKTSYPTKKLGEVVKIQSGFGFSKSLQGKQNESIPFLKVSDMTSHDNDIYITKHNNTVSEQDLEEWKFKTAPKGTVIFPKVGGAIATNKKRILTQASVYDNNTMGLVLSDRINSKYLFYWLNSFNLSEWASGSSLPAITKSRVEETEIPLPPLETQKKIVAKVDDLFAKIKEAKTLRAEAQEDAANLLPAALHKIFEEGKEKGWEEKEIQSVSHKVEYGTSQKTKSEGDVPVLRMNNLAGGSVKFDNLKFLDEDASDLPKLYLKNNDILFNRTNSFDQVGKTGIYKGSDDVATFASYLVRIVVDNTKADPDFINYFLNSPLCRRKQIEPGITKQVGQANFSGGKLKAVKVPLPPLSEQKQVVEYLDSLSEKTQSLRQAQAKTATDLTDLEQSILHKAFEGELI